MIILDRSAMEFDHRKLLLITKRDKLEDCFDECRKKDDDCFKLCQDFYSPPKPPLKHLEAHTVRKSLLITGCLVTAVFVFCLVFMIVKRFLSGRNDDGDRFTRNLPILFDTQESFADEDQRGPSVDHHIWFINTVGLPPSVIDAIGVIGYKKDEGLIESTECSVCLSEFEDGESVRLLPKCSHAFHVACIDTWLRSHKNCPLCRAPIVRRDASSGAASFPSVSERISGELGSEDENPAGNSGPIEEGGSSTGIRVEDSDSESVIRRCGRSRVLSDLSGKRGVLRDAITPVRRSVSLDAASAVAMRNAVAIRVSDIGSSDSRRLGSKSGKGSNIAVFSKRVGENLSIYRLMRSSSIGISLQKGPVLMKRSHSSRRVLNYSKHRRTQSSIIPS